MAGYYGYTKMSNNAVTAYDEGKMPLSKWSKYNILCYLETELGVDTTNIKKLTKNELCDSFLRFSEWHHTGSYYNKTDFYGVVEEEVSEFLENEKENIDKIIKNRVKKERVKKEVTPIYYITARVKYENWEGTRKHPKKEHYDEIVYFMSNDKKVQCSVGMKRLSSLTILNQIQQKTKFADGNRVMKMEARSNKNYLNREDIIDKDEVLSKVKVDAWALKYASEQLRNDKDFMLEAIRINPDALWWSSEQLRDDKEFMLMAIKINPKFIRYASDELLNDSELRQLADDGEEIEQLDELEM